MNVKARKWWFWTIITDFSHFVVIVHGSTHLFRVHTHVIIKLKSLPIYLYIQFSYHWVCIRTFEKWENMKAPSIKSSILFVSSKLPQKFNVQYSIIMHRKRVQPTRLLCSTFGTISTIDNATWTHHTLVEHTNQWARVLIIFLYKCTRAYTARCKPKPWHMLKCIDVLSSTKGHSVGTSNFEKKDQVGHVAWTNERYCFLEAAVHLYVV